MKGSRAPMIYFCMYEFIYLNKGKITPNGNFMNANVEKIFESEYVCTSTKQVRKILGAKYQKAYFKKIMKNQ